MGCAASKVEQEDTVRRCKERRRNIRDAVAARQQLASAHADYLRSLRLTAAALSRFAQGHPSLAVSHHTAPVLLSTAAPPAALAPAPPAPAISSSVAPSSSLPPPTPPLPRHQAHHHPPPPPQPPQQQHAAAVSARERDPRMMRRLKVPHILSDSSVASPAQSSFRKPPVVGTPSSSSAWDWENFYPPSPPDSEFFDRRKTDLEEANRLRELDEEVDKARTRSYLHPGSRDRLKEEDEDEVATDDEEDDEDAHCGGWEDEEDHYASTTTSETRSEEGELGNRSECGFAARSEYGGTAPSEYAAAVPAPLQLRRRDERSEAGDSSSTVTAATEMRMVVRHRTLSEIVAAIEEYFVKAADAGDGVSELLEASRAQLDRNFRQLKKTVYHSNSVLSALSSTWTSKPPLAVRYKLDTNALEMESTEGKSHGSTLERLLAWEKKLYEEVKARESVKIEHEKKLSTLQSLEYRGRDSAKLDKTKASINKLQSLIVVTSQAATTTSTAIVRVRDTELAPQLVELCFALLSMWRSMNHFHEIQSEIVQQVRGLVDNSLAESTSDLHRLATRDLEAAVSAWYSNFNRLIQWRCELPRLDISTPIWSPPPPPFHPRHPHARARGSETLAELEPSPLPHRRGASRAAAAAAMDPAAEPSWRPPAAASGASSAVTGQSNGRRRRQQPRTEPPPPSEDDSSRPVSTSGGGGSQDLIDSEAKRFRANKSSDDNGSFRTDAEGDSRNGSKVVDQNPPPPEPPKQDYIHVRARRGQATDSHSLAERARREKITERMKILQDLVPGCNKVIGKASVLDEIINYVQALERQVEFLSMKLEAVNAHVNNGVETFPSKDFSAPTFNTAPGLTFDPQTPREYAQGSPASEWLHMQIGGTYERVT